MRQRACPRGPACAILVPKEGAMAALRSVAGLAIALMSPAVAQETSQDSTAVSAAQIVACAEARNCRNMKTS